MAAGVHYVRCIKPNTVNKPALFDMAHSAHQLRCAGVLEAVRISRMAYPNRLGDTAGLALPFGGRRSLGSLAKGFGDGPRVGFVFMFGKGGYTQKVTIRR